jgi:chromosomal replication initiation ATPase DnaA
MKQELFNQYVDWVSQIFNLPKEVIFSKSREQNIVEARHMIYYLCHERGISLISIKNFLSDYGYSIHNPALLYGIKKIKNKVQSDDDYSVLTDRIQRGVSI